MSDTHVEDRPHNSLRGQVSEAEWETRVALAAGCRITQHFGWNDTIRNHLTARVPDEPDEGERIAGLLGENLCIIMKNHGLLSIGRTLPETFVNMERLIDACQIQVDLMATGADIQEVPVEICEESYEKFQGRTVGRPMGELDWKAYVRLADRIDPSYKL